MTKQQPPQMDDYIAVANAVRAINPKHQRTVVDWVKAQRKVDFYVDKAAWIADQPVTNHCGSDAPYLEQTTGVTQNKLDGMHKAALRGEEKWHDKALELESCMPRRELENATKQMIAAVEFIDRHEAAHRAHMQMRQYNQAADYAINEELASASSKVLAAMANLMMERIAK